MSTQRHEWDLNQFVKYPERRGGHKKITAPVISTTTDMFEVHHPSRWSCLYGWLVIGNWWLVVGGPMEDVDAEFKLWGKAGLNIHIGRSLALPLAPCRIWLASRPRYIYLSVNGNRYWRMESVLSHRCRAVGSMEQIIQTTAFETLESRSTATAYRFDCRAPSNANI